MSEQFLNKKTEEYISSRDAARLFGVTHDYVSRLCRKGDLAGILDGRKWLVRKDSLEVFFASRGSKQKFSIVETDPYITSKEAARMYRVTNDYIARLCKQGKLKGELRDRTWMIEQNSLASFFATRTPYVSDEEKDVPEQSVQVYQLPAAETAVKEKIVLVARTAPQYAYVIAAMFGILLLSASAFGMSRTNPDGQLAGAWSGFMGAFNGINSLFFGNGFATTQAPAQTSAISQPQVAMTQTPAPTHSTTTLQTIIEQKTYPVTVRTIERVLTQTGVTLGDVETQVQQANNKLRSELYAQLNSSPGPTYGGGGSITTNLALAQRIDQLSGTILSNVVVHGVTGLTASDIPALDYFSTGSTLAVTSGGTGTSTAPTYGKLLVGNTAGGYDLLATSSLGIVASGGGGSSFGQGWEITGGYLAPTSTIGILVVASSTIGGGTPTTGLTINGGATTTGNLVVGGTLTGMTNTTGSGSIVLSTSPTIGGTATFNSLRSSGAGTIQGGSTATSQLTLAGTISASPTTASLILAASSATGASLTLSSTTANFTGNFGVGTSSPFAKFVIAANNGDTATTLFAIGSSTQAATSTLFSVSNTGKVIMGTSTDYSRFSWDPMTSSLSITTRAGGPTLDFLQSNYFQVGVGTKYLEMNDGFFTTSGTQRLLTFDGNTTNSLDDIFNVGSKLRISQTGTTTLSGLNISATATSTSNVGFNLAAGCYAVGGACLSASSLGAATFAWPFTPTTNFGATANSTSTPVWFTAGLQASSTSHFANLDYSGTFNFASTSANASSTLFSFRGESLLVASTTGFNTGFGLSALAQVISGNKNTALGYQALENATSSTLNVALGYQALQGDILTAFSGSKNIAVGGSALQFNTSGSRNVALGNDAAINNGSGSDNVAIGDSSLYWNSAGNKNVAIGGGALGANNNNSNNTAIGYFAGNSVDSVNNTLIGYYAGQNIYQGYSNIIIGSAETSGVTQGPTSGSGNIGIGNRIYFPSQSASNQLNIGGLVFGTVPATSTAFRLPTSGSIGIGTSSPFAKFSIQTNNGDTATTLFAIGSSTQTSTTTLFSVSNIGVVKLNPDSSTTTVFTINGQKLLTTSATGMDVYLGAKAGGQQTNLTRANVGVGVEALASNTTGGNSVAVGYQSLLANIAGSSNTAIGQAALSANTFGNFNTALGDSALLSNQSGSKNTAVGFWSLIAASSSNNTALGYFAGQNVSTGSENNLFGVQAGNNLTTGSNNIALGYNALLPGATGNNQLNIGNLLFGTLPATTSASTLTLPTSGTFGIGTSSPFAKFSIQTNNGDTATTLFAIGSSTQTSTTTLFSIDSIGVTSIRTSSSTIFNLNGSQFLVANNGAGNLALDSGGALANRTTGFDLAAFGAGALASNTSGGENTAVGFIALTNNTTGGNNTAVGSMALLANTTGQLNVAIGDSALYNATSSTGNVAIGSQTLVNFRANTANGYNTAVGYSSLTASSFYGTRNSTLGALSGQNLTGSNNTLLGYLTAGNANAASYNTFIGYQAGSTLNSGDGNILIGASQNVSNLTDGAGNIGLGNNLFFPSAAGNNQLNLGGLVFGTLPATSTVFRLPTSGSLGIGTSSPFAKFAIAANNGDTAKTLFAIGSSTANATSTLFSISNTGSTTLFQLNSSLLKTNANGTIVAAVSGTDYVTGAGLAAAYPFQVTGNATSTLTQFNGGLTAYASTTIGSGTATTGLTVSGNATTTLNAYFGGAVGVGIQNSVANTIDIAAAGNYRQGGNIILNTTPSLFNTMVGYGASPSLTTGNLNTAVGQSALQNATSSAENTAVGYQALMSSATISNAGGSTAVGAYALANNTTGIQNTALGRGALYTNTQGNYNNAVGYGALFNNATGTENGAFGFNALFNNTTGSRNLALGSQAALRNTTGDDNLSIGTYANYANQTGSANVTIGKEAGAGAFGTYSRTGSTLIGTYAGQVLQAANFNTLIGYAAGNAITTGSNNTILGSDDFTTLGALTGTYNVSIGSNLTMPSASASGQLNIQNIIFGTGNTGTGSTLSTGNVGIGSTSPFAKFAIAANNGSTNTTLFAIGSSTQTGTTTLFSVNNIGTINTNLNSATTTLFNFKSQTFLTVSDSSFNTSLGLNALSTVTTGGGNTAFGQQALNVDTTGLGNTAVGYYAMGVNVSGSNNVAFGDGALSASVSGSNNVAIGHNALLSAAAPSRAVAIGYFAGNGLGGSQTGAVSIGYQTGSNLDAGADYNTLVGYQAGYKVFSGYANIMLGAHISTASAGQISAGNGNIGIGNELYFPGDVNNQLNIGNFLFGTVPATSTAFRLPTSGAIGIGTSSPFAKFAIATNNGDTATTLFAIGSSTQSATTTLFSVNNNGVVGIGTSTPTTLYGGTFASAGPIFVGGASTTATSTIQGNLLVIGTLKVGLNSTYISENGILTTNSSPSFDFSNAAGVALSISHSGFGTTTLSGLNVSGQATSTSNVGFNITDGCYAINNTCLPSSIFSYLFPNNATTTQLAFNGGLTAFASSTIGNGTQTGGLTISGGATTTGNAYFAGTVGIGTASPNYQLEVNGSTGIGLTDGSGTTYDSTITHSATSPFRFLTLTSKAGGGGWRGGINFDTSYNAGNTFTAMTIRANIDGATANVGVGTTSPFANLSIHANNGSTNTMLFAIGSSTQSATTTLFSVDNTGLTTVGNSGGTGDANFQFAGDTNAWSVGYRSSDKAFAIASSTNLTGTAALSIAKNGNTTIVGSGTTCVIGSGTGATSCTSDQRLKDNIVPISGTEALSKLSLIQGVTFNWADPSRDQNGQVGVIAQNVLKAFPQLVGSTTVNFKGAIGNYFTVNYDGLVSPLISAVNELNARTSFISATTTYSVQSGTTTAVTISAGMTTFAASSATGTLPIISISAPASSTPGVSINGTLYLNGQDITSVASTTATTTPDALVQGPFALATAGLKATINSALAALQNIARYGVRNLGAAVYATVGTFNQLFASTITATDITADTVNAQKLCLGTTCVTEVQLQNLLNGSAATAQASGGQVSSATSSTLTGTSTPPVITVNGANPATIAVGDTYNDLGATAKDSLGNDLTVHTFMNGSLLEPLIIDTSGMATDTIEYVATDTWGNTATGTRTLIIQ